MIIDCHAHALAFPQLTRNDGQSLLLSAEKQVAQMDAKGIAKALLLGAPSISAQSIGEILHICDRYPERFIPFCSFDPRLDRRSDFPTSAFYTSLLAQYRQLGCRGFGELTTRIPWDEPALLALLDACWRTDFPVTFHTTSPDYPGYGVIDEIGLPGLERMLQRFPELAVFGHSVAFWSEISTGVTPETKNEISQGQIACGGRVPELLRRYPRLYGDLSGASGLNALTRDTMHAYEFLDEFQDRLLLGLNQCLLGTDRSHIEWLTTARDLGHITRAVWEKIMWKNIDRVLMLGLADEPNPSAERSEETV